MVRIRRGLQSAVVDGPVVMERIKSAAEFTTEQSNRVEVNIERALGVVRTVFLT